MKKVLIGLVLTIFMAGCNEQSKTVNPMRMEVLPTHPQWEQKYGDSDESNVYSNIKVLINTAVEQRKFNTYVASKLNELEVAIAEPNEPNE